MHHCDPVAIGLLVQGDHVKEVEGRVRAHIHGLVGAIEDEGELDVVTNNGRIFYDAITSEKKWIMLSEVGHGIPGNPEGVAVIQDKLLEGLETIP